MAIKSLARSSILQPQETRFALAGYQTNMFHHLETIRLSSTASTVEFTNLAQYSDYEHLQIRYAARTARTGINYTDIVLRLNSDGAANYADHRLLGNGSSVISNGNTGRNQIQRIVGASANTTTDAFGAGVIDILDAFNSSKNTTVRALSGLAANETNITLSSGLWLNTAALTTITIFDVVSANLLAGSRFSLYGLKVRA